MPSPAMNSILFVKSVSPKAVQEGEDESNRNPTRSVTHTVNRKWNESVFHSCTACLSLPPFPFPAGSFVHDNELRPRYLPVTTLVLFLVPANASQR